MSPLGSFALSKPWSLSGFSLGMRAVGWLYSAVVCLGSSPRFISMYLHPRTQTKGAAAVWGMVRSWWRAEGQEEGKLFRLFKASARMGHMLCLPPLQSKSQSHILNQWDWEWTVHLLEAMAKAKREWFIDLISYRNKCNPRARSLVKEVQGDYIGAILLDESNSRSQCTQDTKEQAALPA